MSTLDFSKAALFVDNKAVNTEHERIARIIRDYNPELRLVWIPADKREVGDIPYAVVHRPANGEEYVVFYVEEHEMNETVLTRIFFNDRSKKDPLAMVESAEAAKNVMMLARQKDEMDEAHDLAYHILKSKKHTYKHNGKVYQ